MKLTIERGTFDGKEGLKAIKAILKVGDQVGVDTIDWQNCTFTRLVLTGCHLKTPSERAFGEWLFGESMKDKTSV